MDWWTWTWKIRNLIKQLLCMQYQMLIRKGCNVLEASLVYNKWRDTIVNCNLKKSVFSTCIHWKIILIWNRWKEKEIANFSHAVLCILNISSYSPNDQRRGERWDGKKASHLHTCFWESGKTHLLCYESRCPCGVINIWLTVQVGQGFFCSQKNQKNLQKKPKP